jgi:single-strand DNA-binding protein
VKKGDGWKLMAFPIAVNESWKAGGEWKKRTHFFDVHYFGNRADEVAARLMKGGEVLVEGKMEQRRWKGKDGGMRYAVGVAARKVVPLLAKHDKAMADVAEELGVPLTDDMPAMEETF